MCTSEKSRIDRLVKITRFPCQCMHSMRKDFSLYMIRRTEVLPLYTETTFKFTKRSIEKKVPWNKVVCFPPPNDTMLYRLRSVSNWHLSLKAILSSGYVYFDWNRIAAKFWSADGTHTPNKNKTKQNPNTSRENRHIWVVIPLHWVLFSIAMTFFKVLES